MAISEKHGKKLAVQLSAAIIIINVLIILVSFAFQYVRINEILLNNAEENSIEWFKQSESNINRFCLQTQKTLVSLASNLNLMRLSNANMLSAADRTYHSCAVLKEFSFLRSQYPDICAVSYYGDDGLILRDAENMRSAIVDADKEDWFYSSGLSQSIAAQRRMGWLGIYTNRDFGFDFRAEQTEHYISAYIPVMSNKGFILLHYETQSYLDLFYPGDDVIDANIYTLNEKSLIVAAQDESAIGDERLFDGGESEFDGVVKHIERDENGNKQVIEYPLPAQGWKLVSETSITKVTKDSMGMRNILLFTCLFSILCTMTISVFGISKMLKPLDQLACEMNKVGTGELGGVIRKWPDNEIGFLIMKFNIMSRQLDEIFKQNKRVEHERREQEMAALRAQINPHFIYNTLNNIKWMAVINNEMNIAQSITLLADYLEPRFRRNASTWTVREEIECVENYIAIMNMRNGNRYILEISIPDDLLERKMLNFLLQPLIENAIIHGFAEMPVGRIAIAMSAEGENGTIRVKDDGQGIEASKLNEIIHKLEQGKSEADGSIGICNVNRRIKVYYGDAYGVRVFNDQSGGAAVELDIRLDS